MDHPHPILRACGHNNRAQMISNATARASDFPDVELSDLVRPMVLAAQRHARQSAPAVPSFRPAGLVNLESRAKGKGTSGSRSTWQSLRFSEAEHDVHGRAPNIAALTLGIPEMNRAEWEPSQQALNLRQPSKTLSCSSVKKLHALGAKEE